MIIYDNLLLFIQGKCSTLCSKSGLPWRRMTGRSRGRCLSPTGVWGSSRSLVLIFIIIIVVVVVIIIITSPLMSSSSSSSSSTSFPNHTHAHILQLPPAAKSQGHPVPNGPPCLAVGAVQTTPQPLHPCPKVDLLPHDDAWVHGPLRLLLCHRDIPPQAKTPQSTYCEL